MRPRRLAYLRPAEAFSVQVVPPASTWTTATAGRRGRCLRGIYFLPSTSMIRSRIDRHTRLKNGIIHPIVDRLVSRHVSYKIAVRTTRRRREKTGRPMGIVVWHDETYVVMPAWRIHDFEAEELIVEYLD